MGNHEIDEEPRDAIWQSNGRGSLQDQSEELLKAGPILLKNLTTSKNNQTIVYSCDDLVPKRNLLEHLERCSKAADLIMGIK